MDSEKQFLKEGKTEIGKILGSYNGQYMNMTVFYGNSVFPRMKKNGKEEFVHLKKENYLKMLEDFLKSEEGKGYVHPSEEEIEKSCIYVINQEKAYMQRQSTAAVKAGETNESTNVKEEKAALAESKEQKKTEIRKDASQEKEAQLAKMFALRDDLANSREEGKLDEIATLSQDSSESQASDAEVSDIGHDNDVKRESQRKKQKINTLSFLFPQVSPSQAGKQRLETGNGSTKPDTDYTEYGETQLLEEEDRKNCKYKLIELSTMQEVYINKPVFLIGCQKGVCDMVIPQDARHHVVSRKHAYIFLKNDKVYIKDMSSNGTYIGTEGMQDDEYYRILKDTETEIKNRQVVRLANIKLMLIENK